MKKFVAAFAAVLVWAAAGAALAAGATRYVATTGSDTGSCTSSPCRTIGYAVARSSSGDSIRVAPGSYAESVKVTKQLALVGSNATIDAAGHDNGIVIAGASSAGTSVRGFTIQHAGLEGIFADNTSRITIAGNNVVQNDAYGPFSPPCINQPDDCGEAVHLQTVTNSVVSGNLVQNNIGGILLTDEEGPTSGNLIADNRVLDNTLDCGITLASHHFSLAAAATPDVAGIYRNTVLHNTSNGNGAAGIGIFAGPPGAAAWGNSVIDNTARNNGLPGVAIHSHTPLQYVNDNVVVNNTLSANGPDDDALTGGPAGVVVFSAVIPIQHTVVAANRISDEQYGIYTVKAVKLSGLPSNKFENVAVPIAIH
jgi:parallel beta-helix repeat protein